ncbi:MAG TPA: hypothetical protein VIF60_21180 [Burkholderiaceae bacterium]
MRQTAALTSRIRSVPCLDMALIVVLLSLSPCGKAASDAISKAQRAAAAQQTAQSSPACKSIQPFYWEIGDGHGALAGGAQGNNAPARDAQMHIASASKLVYAAYVAQRRDGNLTDGDVRFLTFRSGYTHFRFCRRNQTEGACLDSFLNGGGRPDAATAGQFDYSGGHMQKHAALMGLGNMNRDALTEEMHRGLTTLGADWKFTYSQAQPAGGGVSSVADYARFLSAIVAGELHISKLLGSHKVCTNPQSCPSEAQKTPIPLDESWHYSIGHWVEDDPKVGDGAFSSPGAFGFYPWISADKQFYGIVGRENHRGLFSADEEEKPAVGSVDCGRAIRAAWIQGIAQP